MTILIMTNYDNSNYDKLWQFKLWHIMTFLFLLKCISTPQYHNSKIMTFKFMTFWIYDNSKSMTFQKYDILWQIKKYDFSKLWLFKIMTN